MRAASLVKYRPASAQDGVALAIVVWFIAGMSLLVAGIVSHARVDTQLAQLHVAKAKVVASGDGAIQLMLASIITGRDRRGDAGPALRQLIQLGGLDVRVTLVPTQGLIDLNGSPGPLLAGLFSIAGGIERSQAISLADNVVKWRSSGPRAQTKKGGGRNRFAAIEDLLRVEGMNRTLLDSVRDYVVVGPPSQSGTDWSLAPDTVLGLMREIDPRKADALEQQRSRSRAETGAQDKKASSARMYRADAVIEFGGRYWLRRCWINMGARGASSLPWQFQRTEPPRVISII